MGERKKPGDAVYNIMLNGCFRSGTTLLDKLLHAHPDIVMASQPFPVLYFYLKEIFLNKKGINFRYPLDHMFNQRGYAHDDFMIFLDTYKISDDDIDIIFEMMEQYTSGLQTPQIKEYRKSIVPGTFLDVYQQFNDCLLTIFPNKNTPLYVGGKEAFVEEYAPFLLKRGIKTIVIIRDPRDVVASVYNSVVEKYMGESRPLLFLLRAWRKSVALSLAYEDDPNFTWLTYEDLVTKTSSTLDKITDFLRIAPFPENIFEKGIFNQDGVLWRGNSSYVRSLELNSSSIGQFTDRLNEQVIGYIEHACYPEMRALGYDFSLSSKYSIDALMSYQEIFDVTHEKFYDCRNYSCSKQRVSDECRRRELLLSDDVTLSDQEIKSWFVFTEAFYKLRYAISDGFKLA